MAELIAKDDANAKREVEQCLERFRDRKELSALVRETDLGRGSSKAPAIVGRALTQLQTHVQPARDLGAEWLGLMDVKLRPKGFVDRSITELRRDLGRYVLPMLQALAECRTESSLPLRAAAVQAKRSADGLLRIFDDDRLDEATAADRIDAMPETIFWRDLLYVTELDLDSEGRPRNWPGAEAVVDLLMNTAAHAPTMSVAFDHRLERGNVGGAALACDDMEKADDPEFDRCRVALAREVCARKDTLIEKLAQLKEPADRRLDPRWSKGALLHESSLARTMPIDKILTGRCDTTLVGRGRSSD